jgi:hypothetical protein
MRRPSPTEYGSYYAGYVDRVPETDVIAVLRDERERVLSLLEPVAPGKVDYRYAPGKWTLRQVLGHVLDMEWIFTARALHFARAVDGPLPGYEQDDVMKLVSWDAIPWASLLDQFRHVRSANIKLFEGFDEAAWSRSGVASGVPVTVRALAFILAGHQRHHLEVIRERYLV